MSKWTAARIRDTKGRQRLACLTAYDCATARLADRAGIPLLLVGDSLGMTVLGYSSTLPVTVEQMLHHTAAVVRGATQAMVVADMPFLSYQVSVEDALRNAGRFLQEAGADAVKIEGGALRAATVEALVRNGIPVLGHIGLTPQSLRALGGYKVQGRRPEEAQRLLDDARALEQAGVFSLVIECVPEALGADITAAVHVPTIGIGAGRHCDGQILVVHDLLGFGEGAAPRFVKTYAAVASIMEQAFQTYRQEVEDGRFPGEEHVYH